MKIGEKIRELRSDANMTQDELASKLLVTRTAISKWETGKGWPGIDSLKLIADEFGCTIDSLVSEEDVTTKRATEDKQWMKFYVLAVACALIAVCAALIGMSGVFSIPQAAVMACRVISMWAMLGYVYLSLRLSESRERTSVKQMLISRIVILVIVLIAVAGFVSTLGAVS